MIWKLIIVQGIAFIIILFFCKAIIKLLEKYLSVRKYKLTQGFSYVITCVIMLVLGLVFGKEVLYIFL